MAEVVRVFNEIHANIAGLAGQRLAQRAGFSMEACTAIQTAILEIARNIVTYAGHGNILIQLVEEGTCVGVRISAIDEGPGIADLAAAFTDGYTTGTGMGRGLPGARRLMDQFEIVSGPGIGTCITMTKWRS